MPPYSLSKMDSHVEPTIATAGPTALSPPRDSLDLIPVGSVEAEEEIETLSPPSEEDHDHANGQNRDQKQNQENSSATAVLTDDLKNKIIKQARARIPPHSRSWNDDPTIFHSRLIFYVFICVVVYMKSLILYSYVCICPYFVGGILFQRWKFADR